MIPDSQNSAILGMKRIRIWFAFVILVVAVFGVRLFYVQVIKYSYYHNAALSDQLKDYQIPATRGLIEAYDAGQTVPIVLNEKLYTLFADPPLVKDATSAANQIASVIGGSVKTYESQMRTPKTQYVILAHKLTQDQSEKILSFKIPGVDTQGLDYRTYPQGDLAGQVLGFVDDNGQGQYGIEQALNNKLAGSAGQLKALTDVNGVPLVANSSNVETQPTPGDNVVLSIDVGMQKQLQTILQQGVQSANGVSGSALIMNPNNGQVVAMANYPNYNPADYQNVSDTNLFNNAAVADPIEIGSSMKLLTTSAALNQGVITPNTTYYDPAQWTIDGFTITNIEQDGGAGVKSIGDILNLSLNTGATWMLMQMGGGQINAKARQIWYNYMVNHFKLGQSTGVEQGYESPGIIPQPNIAQESDAQQDLAYANTAFGQGVLITPIQLGAAVSSILNGGTYYQPTLVSSMVSPNGDVIPNKPKVVERNVVSPSVGQGLIPLMEFVVQQHYASGFSYLKFPSNYIVGGKTGTAQIANPAGGYLTNIYNGTYVGFVGGDKPQYVIIVYVIKPNIPNFAGSYAAQPIFANIAHMLINESYVSPKS